MFDSAIRLDSVFEFQPNPLSIKHRLTLARGKGYRPPAKVLDAEKLTTELHQSLQTYARNLRLKAMFGTSEAAPPKLYFPNPGFTPERAPESLENYIATVEESIVSATNRVNLRYEEYVKMTKYSKPSQEMYLLTNHLKHTDTVVAPCDKNLGLATIPKADYRNLLLSTLRSDSFRNMSANEAKARIRRTKARIQRLCNGHFNKDDKGRCPNMHSYITLKVQDPKPAKPYLLLKVHKMSTQELVNKNSPPTRLIVPCFDTIIEPLSRYLDQELQPEYNRLARYNLKDSTQLLRIIESTSFNANCVLSAKDYHALYPSVPLEDGFMEHDRFLQSLPWTNNKITFHMKATKLIMRNSILLFEEKYYIQTNGTAMGNPYAVCFANVYVHQKTKHIIAAHKANGRLLLFLRLIDDCFSVFRAMTYEINFWREMNAVCHNLTATGPAGDIVNMLDLTISKGKRFRATGNLDVTMHRKSYNPHLYIPYDSSHPPNSKLAWMHSELQRIVRSNSRFDNYIKDRNTFMQRVSDRGYPKNLLESVSRKVRYSQRNNLIHGESNRQKKKNVAQPAVFVTKYSVQTAAMNIPKILHQGWEETTATLPQPWNQVKPITAYRRTPNIFDVLRKLLPR